MTMAVQARRRVAEATDTLRRGFGEAGRRIVNPRFVDVHAQRATRGGQFLAAILLFAMIPLSLIMVKISHSMLVTFVLRGTDGPENTPFVVTLVTFALLVMASWFWFQWVRTAGFGMTNVLSGGDS